MHIFNCSRKALSKLPGSHVLCCGKRHALAEGGASCQDLVGVWSLPSDSDPLHSLMNMLEVTGSKVQCV